MKPDPINQIPRPLDAVRLYWREAVGRLRKGAVCLAVALVAFYLPLPELTPDMRRAAFVFLLAAGLWVSEAIPLYATSLLVIGLNILLLARPGEGGTDYETFLQPASDPILVLFFGGFLLARAASRYRLDMAMAQVMLRPFGTRPAFVLLGVMSITGLFSMWMSNTATTAMMLAILGPMLALIDREDPFRKALVLGIPFAANIGGIGTPVGTPPNAVGVAALARAGHPITFLQWTMVATPLALLLMLVAWVVLLRMFPPRAKRFELRRPENFRLPLTAYVVGGVFAVTVLLWLTGEFTGIPAAVVALLPAVVFTALSLLDAETLRNIEWDVLILIAGGIALGQAMTHTGLDRWVVAAMPLQGLAPLVIVALFGLLSLTLSSVMSHTAASNLLIPVAVSLAVSSPVWLVVVVVLASSSAMALPISTPPNAMAYATGQIDSRDMLKAGSLVSLIAVALVVLTGRWVLGVWGLV